MQKQPRFAVTTLVLVTLTAMAVLSRILSPYIVAPSNKRLLNADSIFLQSALHQHVSWYPLSERAFQDAHRLDRPILLVIGAPWSLVGRQMDASVFSSATVQKLITREFISIRVDAVESPDWMAAYLPLGRAENGLQSDFQIWILDSQGRLFRRVAPHVMENVPTEAQFNGELATDLSDLQIARDAEFNLQESISLPGSLQSDDLAHLFASPQNLSPNLVGYAQNLVSLTGSSKAGGFPVGGRQRLWPSAWTFLLASQGDDAIVTSLDGLLKSPCTDLLDGGFFYGSVDQSWRAPAFDKVAVLNAEMCELLSRLSLRSPNPYRQFALSTFDSLTGEFLDSENLIRPCRMGDEQGHFGRSGRASFSPRQIRAALTIEQRKWAYQFLNLRPTTDPVVTPFVTDFGVLEDSQFATVIDQLKKSGNVPPFDREVTLSTFGPSAARIMSAARLLHDRVRLQKAEDIVGQIELFRRGVDVVHELTPGERSQPVFSDYVGYADAALEDFLSFGRVASLQNGAAILRRGFSLFGVSGQSCFRMSLPNSLHRLAPDSNTPEICDDAGESSNAKAIRLGWSYSSLLAGSTSHADRELAAALKAAASACLTQFADSAPNMGPYTGGYGYAAALAADNTFVLCAGLVPSEMAATMFTKSPLRLVAPVIGPVYPELFKKPGYYVCRRGQMIGPLTRDAAAAMLPPTLAINE